MTRERGVGSLRRKSMRFSVLVLLALLVAGCGGSDDKRGTSAGDTSDGCLLATTGPRPTVKADLDGDGTDEDVEDVAGKGTEDCAPRYLEAEVSGRTLLVPVTDVLEVAENGLSAVTVPGRKGELVLLQLSHPRGGFQAHLYGYADGKLAELTSDGRPIFGFLATDAPTEHVAATCTRNGFEVIEAVAHQPIGVVPAWDIYRTTYEVDGNAVTPGDRTEVADNVLDEQLETRHADLVANRLFANC